MPRKKLIEVALPLEAINAASAREKSIRHGHPSTLHLWWARRPLAACRAVIFASLVDDPDDLEAPSAFVEACRALSYGPIDPAKDTPRQRLFKFIETLVQWESTTDEAVLEDARRLVALATEGHPPPLLDPFAGGGAIPLEGQRLGLEVQASDLNPVAVMINKALVEIPPKFAKRPPVNPRDQANLAGGEGWKGAAGLAADVRYYGAWMWEQALARIGHLYPKYKGETVIAWLWARTVRCPNPACGARMPLVRSFELRKKKNRRAWVVPQVDPQSRKITFRVETGAGQAPAGTVNRLGAVCLACQTAVPLTYIRAEGQAKRMTAQMMAIVTEGKGRRNYYAPTPEQEQVARVPIPDDAPLTDLPEQALGFRVQLYGLTKHRDLFTPRQLTALTTFSDLVAEAREQIEADAQTVGLNDDATPLRDGGTGAQAYAEAVSIYLGFMVDQLANYQSTICTWHVPNTQMRNTFARQALPMAWDYAESNLFCQSSGSYHNLFERLLKGFEAIPTFGHGSAFQADAVQLSNRPYTIISTDPPYYDNIGYADLSDFFYVWLRPNLRKIYPNLFDTMLTPKEPELIAAPYRFKGRKKAAKEHFEEGLRQAFAQMRDNALSNYPLTVYYAFKQQEVVLEEGTASTGWETMLTGLIKTGFQIVGTWPMRTEMGSRLRGQGSNALASSIVLVCRPRPEDAPLTSRRGFINALRGELPQALQEMQSAYIAPVDLAQASIGPGMAVYSRYRKVLETDGNPLSVRTALQLINHELDAYLTEQEGDIDSASRFALAWFEQFGFQAGDFGQADVLARAKNTSLEGLQKAGVLKADAGEVLLLRWQELDPNWQPKQTAALTVWEVTHHLLERLNNGGETGAAMLMAKIASEQVAEARQLAYRLYAICERKGWAGQASDYNALVISWRASQEEAGRYQTQYQQGRFLA